VRPLDPWPHSEAGRFHRVVALVLVALALLVLAVAGVRHHEPGEAALVGGAALAALAVGRWLGADLRRHPANFPAPGLGMVVTGADGRRPRSRWASQNRTGGMP
jgi:hypothetical protein